jgi:uncharacterized membrane protein YjjP (DUF1212 family)
VWRLDFIAATHAGATFVRPVGPIGVNLVRVGEAMALSERAARGEITAVSIGAELERIKHLASPYGRWLAVVLAAATGACFSQIADGDWGSFGIALVAAGLGQFARSMLQTAAALTTLTSGFLSALIACVGLRFDFSEAAPATLMASVIYLVPGLPLIDGFIDMASHRHLLVGVERVVNGVYLFLLLAIAIALARAVLL